ncbi:MAG: hypothetical protein AABW68_05520 [archaeon]
MREIVFLAGILLLLAGCTSPAAEENTLSSDTGKATPAGENALTNPNPTTGRTFLIGTAGFVPKNYPASKTEDWQSLFESLPEYGELFGVYSGWNDTPKEGIPEQIRTAYELKKQSGIEPLIAIGIEPDSLTQEEADHYFVTHRDAFIETARKIAQTYQPKYLALGVEINRFYEKSPVGFDAFVETYTLAHEAIKQQSPNTKIFPIFQWDYLRGKATLSGKTHSPNMELRQRFSGKMDAIGYTAYPFLEYTHPNEISDAYFSEMTFEGLPILITETGWPSQPVASIQGSEEGQTDYLTRLVERTKLLEMEGLIWVFPHASKIPAGGGLFDEISMKKNDGTPKQVWNEWQNLREK